MGIPSIKDIANQKKHGLSFGKVVSVFKDPNVFTVFDDEHSDIDEDRWISIGRIPTGVVCLVSHTYRSIDGKVVAIRIISARVADKNEEWQYYSP